MFYQLLSENFVLRCFVSFFFAFFLALLTGGKFISFMRTRQNGGQPIRDVGPESHLSKKGTPTMGGILIVATTIIATLLISNLSNQLVWVVLFVFLGYAFLGFVDDYLKVKKRNVTGVKGKLKIVSQFLIGLVAILWIKSILGEDIAYRINANLIDGLFIDVGIFYIPFALIVLIGTSNAVNLTDGLDGLVSVPVIVAAICFAIIAYIVGDQVASFKFNVDYINGADELIVLISALAGSLLAFLYYNNYPAKLFMGDTGSLALGGFLGTIALITKHEILFVIIGALFVIEALSVIIQIYYFKFTGGKRFFKMAPIHHHFEKLGWFETKVVIRFWIASIIFGIVGMSFILV